MSSNISRRHVAKGAAWAVPTVAVATASPATATSTPTPNCTEALPVTINWSDGSYVRNSSTSGTWTYTPQDKRYPSVTLSISSTLNSGSEQYGNQLRTVNDNLSIRSSEDPGNLALHQSPISNYSKYGPGNGQTVNFEFSTSVRNLVVPIRDVDSQACDFWDAVAVSSSSSYSYTRGGSLTGSGSSSNPFRMYADNIPMQPGQCTVTVSFQQPTSSFCTKYWNITSATNGSDADQRIFFGNISFDLLPSGC